MKEEIKILRAKNNKELLDELKKNYEDLRTLRFQAKMRELKNVNKIKKIRKNIAQILTLLREKLTEEIDEKETKGNDNK